MSRNRCSTLLVTAGLLGMFAWGCATAGSDGDGDGGSEDRDGDITVTPDADPNAPDGTPTSDTDAGGGTCPTDPCDLIEQCGCAGSEACDLASDPFSGNECRSVNNPGTESDTCNTLQDCAAGYVCVGGAGGSSCKPYCASDNDCDSPRGQCLIQLQSGGTDIPGAVVCSSNCEPTSTAPGACPSGWGCYIYVADVNGQDVNIADCEEAGAGTQNATCSDYGDCAPGYLCVGTNEGDRCLRTCTNIDSPCTDVTGDCLSFDPPADIGGTTYGVCL